MSARPPTPKAPAIRPADGPRTASGKDKQGSLGWVKGVLGRSIGLEQRRNQLHVVLVDGQRSPAADKLQTPLQQMRGELRTRLLVHDPATQAVRNLVVIYEELGRSGGWSGVQALPRAVLDKALAEAEMQDIQDPTPLMSMIIEKLRELGNAATIRAEHQAEMREAEEIEIPEVSEATHEEWELMERSWIGTVPSGLAQQEPDL
jgi:hypothetical protein